MRPSVFRVVFGLAFALLVAGAAGCGVKRHDVSGQVKYNGSPLDKPGGQVVFVAPDGSQVAAAIGADGSYRAAKVLAGPNRVAVYYPNPAAVGARPPKPKPGEPPPVLPSPYLTPIKYATPDTSELKVEVAQDTVFNVDMTGPAMK